MSEHEQAIREFLARGGTIQHVPEGASGRQKNYFCLDKITGKHKTFYRKPLAVAVDWCQVHWRGSEWEIIEHMGKIIKDTDKVVARSE